MRYVSNAVISKYYFAMTLWGQYHYYVHFLDEETAVEKPSACSSAPRRFTRNWTWLRPPDPGSWALEPITTLYGALFHPSSVDTLDHPPCQHDHLSLPLGRSRGGQRRVWADRSSASESHLSPYVLLFNYTSNLESTQDFEKTLKVLMSSWHRLLWRLPTTF